MTFATKILEFYSQIEKPIVPSDIELLWPYENEDVKLLVTTFFNKFYSDHNERIILFGINPGRFGAGVTGIGFTDPIRLRSDCGIENNLPQHAELSSVFIYDMIKHWGGPSDFFSKFFFSAVSPIGYTHRGKNINYYDRKDLQEATNDFIINCLQAHIQLNVNKKVAFVIGQGKNLDILHGLNNRFHFFEHIKALPHPRWIMQYNLKDKHKHIESYLQKLSEAL